ncbi:MAG TPA: ankyrin repeat domain-containing protein [Candidatus Limnocylindrales bacterium]|nr:ankyrin repeat domain-containing protein [Candidatus Limnocylindrales bacterium]
MRPRHHHDKQKQEPAPPAFELTAEKTSRLLFPAIWQPRDGGEKRCVPTRDAGAVPAWLDAALASLSCTPEARSVLASDEPASPPVDRLTAAALCNDADAVRRLVADGANPNSRDSCGWTALVAAAAAGHQDAMRALLERGARPDLASRAGRWSRSPLLAALMRGDTAAANTLLDARAHAGLATIEGHDALMFAAIGTDQELIRRLLRSHADPCRADGSGLTAAELAHAYGNTSVAAMLNRAARRCSAKAAQE